MEDQLAGELIKLARKTENGLTAYLDEVVDEFIVEGTRTRLRNYYLKLNIHGEPRLRDLHKALASHVLDYAIPRSKINDAYADFLKTGSSAKVTALAEKARDLFTSLAKTGEGGELLLFTFCEQVLELPLVIAKMNLKTDTQMHFHGADGVYAGLSEKGFLKLYWGESKIYSDRSQAMNDCFDSLAKLLIPAHGEASEVDRDLELLRDYSDLGNQELTDQLQALLMSDNPDFNDVDFGGVCLIGFTEDCYPCSSHTLQNDELKEQVKLKIKAYTKSISHHVGKYKLKNLELISICLPIPSAETFREQFLQTVLKK